MLAKLRHLFIPQNFARPALISVFYSLDPHKIRSRDPRTVPVSPDQFRDNDCLEQSLFPSTLHHSLIFLPLFDAILSVTFVASINPLKPELNPICDLLALLGAHHFFHVSRIRAKLLTFRLLMSYIYMEHPFLMFLDHTQRPSTVGRTPLDE